MSGAGASPAVATSPLPLPPESPGMVWRSGSLPGQFALFPAIHVLNAADGAAGHNANGRLCQWEIVRVRGVSSPVLIRR